MAEQLKQPRSLERHEPRSSFVTWSVVILLVLLMFGKTALLFVAVGDRRPQYHYLSQPYIPASAYSATEPSPTTTTTAPKQVELPPAVVGKRAK